MFGDAFGEAFGGVGEVALPSHLVITDQCFSNDCSPIPYLRKCQYSRGLIINSMISHNKKNNVIYFPMTKQND